MNSTSNIEQVKRIHDIFILLMQVSKRWFVQRLQGYGLTLPQFIALASLTAYQKPSTMSDLTNVTFHDPPTMTGVIDRLVRLKLVRRTRSETDRRVVLVEATNSGIELVDDIETAIMGEMANGYNLLTDRQLDDLEHLLHSLLRVHLMLYKQLPNNVDIDTELKKLELFVKNPIAYAKSENEKLIV